MKTLRIYVIKQPPEKKYTNLESCWFNPQILWYISTSSNQGANFEM